MLRIWCASHQIDIVVKVAAEGIDNGVWVKQAGLHVFGLPTRVGQPDHRHEHEVPTEDESLGAPGPPIELLQVVSPVALGAHQGQAAQPDAVGPVVDYHIYGGTGDRRDQRHVGPFVSQVIVDRPIGNSRAKLVRHNHCHV
jgi:hypothetical protein